MIKWLKHLWHTNVLAAAIITAVLIYVAYQIFLALTVATVVGAAYSSNQNEIQNATLFTPGP